MTRMMKLAVLVPLLCLAGVTPAYAGAVRAAPPACANAGTAPTATEVKVFTQTNFGGNCFSLVLNADGNGDTWTGWEASFGFPNDQIRSVKTGSGVSLVMFWDSYYTKKNDAPFNAAPNAQISNLGIWNGAASAARVQTFAPNSCPSSGSSNKLVLFTDPGFAGDCVELGLGNRRHPLILVAA